MRTFNATLGALISAALALSGCTTRYHYKLNLSFAGQPGVCQIRVGSGGPVTCEASRMLGGNSYEPGMCAPANIVIGPCEQEVTIDWKRTGVIRRVQQDSRFDSVWTDPSDTPEAHVPVGTSVRQDVGWLLWGGGWEGTFVLGLRIQGREAEQRWEMRATNREFTHSTVE